MGGFVIGFVIIVILLIFYKKYFVIGVLLIVIVVFGFIGFIDDFIKVVLKRLLGFCVCEKLVF